MVWRLVPAWQKQTLRIDAAHSGSIMIKIVGTSDYVVSTLILVVGYLSQLMASMGLYYKLNDT